MIQKLPEIVKSTSQIHKTVLIWIVWFWTVTLQTTTNDHIFNYIHIYIFFIGFWQLCRHSYDRWWTIHFRSVWYCGSRRLRQVKTTFLSTNRCVSCLLFSSFSIILRKCQRKGKCGLLILIRSHKSRANVSNQLLWTFQF